MMTAVSTIFTFALFAFATIGLMTVWAIGKLLFFVLGVLGILTLCYLAVVGIDRAAAKCFDKEPSTFLEIAKTSLHAACWLSMIGLAVLLFRLIFS